MNRQATLIRLAIVSSGLGVGGAESMLARMVPRLKELGIAPVVVSLRDIGPTGRLLQRAGIEVRALELPHLRAVHALPAAVHWLRSWRPDLIQGWMYHGNVAAIGAAAVLRRRVPVVLGVRASLTRLSGEPWALRATIGLGARLADRAAAVIYNAQAARIQHEAIGYPARCGLVIPNGFDTERFAPDPSARLAVRRELGLPEGASLVGLFARWHPMKDHATFLRAAARIAAARPEIRFVLAGTAVDARNARLLAMIAAQGLGAQVALLGERADLPRLTAALDVACLASSRSEGFPNVLGEAMSCGVACVTTDVGDAAAVVASPGAVVAPGDADAYARAVIAAIDVSGTERALRAQALRRRVIEHYSLDAVARRYADVYANLYASLAANANCPVM